MTVSTELLATTLLDGAIEVPIDGLVPSPTNPRTKFDVDDLVHSIASSGVLQPLLARKVPAGRLHEGKLEIVDGERRWRASKVIGALRLPVIVREMSDDDVRQAQLVSAIQREALGPMAEARAMGDLIAQAIAGDAAAPWRIRDLAVRLGKSERYVADGLRLLGLVPTAQTLVETGRIGLPLARQLAMLKAEDQERAINPGINGDEPGYRDHEPGGLWRRLGVTLFDADDEEKIKADPFFGLKPASLEEFEAWVARHVRFDLDHAATVAPLDFGDVAGAVAAAQAKPGRGRKVVLVTLDGRLEDDVRGGERVLGPRAWRRADGKPMIDGDGRELHSGATCDHAVLGLVAVGPYYGEQFPVCIRRQDCQAHWATEIAEREEARKRAERAGGGAGRSASSAGDDYATRQKKEADRRQKAAAAYKQLHDALVPLLRAKAPAALDRRVTELIYEDLTGRSLPKAAKTARDFVWLLIERFIAEPTDQMWDGEGAGENLQSLCKRFGVNPDPVIKKLAAAEVAAKAQAKAAAKAAKKAAAPAKAAPKPAAKKAGRR